MNKWTSCSIKTTAVLLLLAGQIAFVSGAAAAVGSGVVKVPIAVCIRSVQAGIYPDVFAAARSIVKAAGPRGLFTVRAGPNKTHNTPTGEGTQAPAC